MKSNISLKSLHPLEIKVIRYFSESDIVNHSAQLVAHECKLGLGQVNQALSWLLNRDLIVEASRSQMTYFELTEIGSSYLHKGSPAEALIAYIQKQGAARLPEIASALGIDNKDIGSAYGSLAKQGLLTMNAEKQVELKPPMSTVLPTEELDSEGTAKEILQASACSTELVTIRKLMNRASKAKDSLLPEHLLAPEELSCIASISKKRGASGGAVFRIVEREEVHYAITQAGKTLSRELKNGDFDGMELGQLTVQMIKDGSWKSQRFRAYNLQVQPSRQYAGRKNPYCEYLDWVRDKLVALGFQEFDGPLVETEFWNSDALFMPQFHAARDIHDVYYIKNPKQAKTIEAPFLENVASVHENGGTSGSRGWNYSFDRDFTRRLILRSQGTVMSAKTLHKAEVPSKYFGILRCFRYDQVDATHLSDFYQTEGIVLSESANLRTLLGLLEIFALEIAGATEVKYVPGYFPFTEPSVEVHIKHPVLGWFELGGSGIFRPEVTEPMGVHVPVLAWGLGIDRMALMHLGLNDLRELFTNNIEDVRLRRA